MSETDHVTLERERFSDLPGAVAVGQEFELRIRGRVRRIEAEHLDVSGFGADGARGYLEGYTFVELSVLDVDVQLPAGA